MRVINALTCSCDVFQIGCIYARNASNHAGWQLFVAFSVFGQSHLKCDHECEHFQWMGIFCRYKFHRWPGTIPLWNFFFLLRFYKIYLFWCFEAQSNFTIMTRAEFALPRDVFAPHNWDCKLFLKSTFGLKHERLNYYIWNNYNIHFVFALYN